MPPSTREVILIGFHFLRLTGDVRYPFCQPSIYRRLVLIGLFFLLKIVGNVSNSNMKINYCTELLLKLLFIKKKAHITSFYSFNNRHNRKDDKKILQICQPCFMQMCWKRGWNVYLSSVVEDTQATVESAVRAQVETKIRPLLGVYIIPKAEFWFIGIYIA